MNLKVGLLNLFVLNGLSLSFFGQVGFVSQNITTPSLDQIGALVVLSSEFLFEVFQFCLVFFSDSGDSDGSDGLFIAEFAESSLALDESEGNVLLSAEGWEPNDGLDGINIVSDEDELGFLFFNESGDFVKSVFNLVGGGLQSGLSVFSLSLGIFSESFSLLLSSLGSVVLEESQNSGGFISVECFGELIQCGRNLQSL